MDSFSVTSVTRYICSRRTIIWATSDWRGVQPTRFAFGAAGRGGVDRSCRPSRCRALAGSPTPRRRCLSQLPSGITRESSRMKRSQSKRVCGGRRRRLPGASSLMEAKSVKSPSCLAWPRAASASGAAAAAFALAVVHGVGAHHVGDGHQRAGRAEHAEHDVARRPSPCRWRSRGAGRCGIRFTAFMRPLPSRGRRPPCRRCGSSPP